MGFLGGGWEEPGGEGQREGDADGDRGAEGGNRRSGGQGKNTEAGYGGQSSEQHAAIAYGGRRAAAFGVYGVVHADGADEQQAEGGEKADGDGKRAQQGDGGDGGGKRYGEDTQAVAAVEARCAQDAPGDKVGGEFQPQRLAARCAEQGIQAGAAVVVADGVAVGQGGEGGAVAHAVEGDAGVQPRAVFLQSPLEAQLL